GGGVPGLRQSGFLEVDVIPIVESITKYAGFIESPERARYHVEKALYLAQEGRPGPVLLDVPLDVQGAPFPEDAPGFHPPPRLFAAPDASQIDAIIERIRNAKRPLVLAGNGVRQAGMVDEFHQFVEALQIPVVT